MIHEQAAHRDGGSFLRNHPRSPWRRSSLDKDRDAITGGGGGGGGVADLVSSPPSMKKSSSEQSLAKLKHYAFLMGVREQTMNGMMQQVGCSTCGSC